MLNVVLWAEQSLRFSKFRKIVPDGATLHEEGSHLQSPNFPSMDITD